MITRKDLDRMHEALRGDLWGPPVLSDDVFLRKLVTGVSELESAALALMAERDLYFEALREMMRISLSYEGYAISKLPKPVQDDLPPAVLKVLLEVEVLISENYQGS